MTKAADLTGKVFNRLTVVKRAERNTAAGKALWVCKCICGSEVVATGNHLSSNHTKSCGCLKADRDKSAKYISHGHARRGEHTSEYMAWHGIISRCNNPNVRNWHSYGGRGITVCERWMKFENFIADMGSRPAGMSIERVDNNKGYSPENCIWASKKAQGNNRSTNRFFTYNGERLTLTQLSEKYDVPNSVLSGRIRRNWPIESAIETPVAR